MQLAARKKWLIGEMLLLYVAGPALVSVAVYQLHVPVIAILPFVFAGLIAVLLRQSDRTWRADLVRLPSRHDVFSILALFVVCGSALTLYTYERYPQFFLALPRSNPRFWLLIMTFYPLISVTTQELVYRVLFFRRYAPALNGAGWLAIAVNAALFAGMHAILFAAHSAQFHWEAVVFSFAGGLIFAYRYTRTHSYLAVALEHALYGDLIFTIGLGRFFFAGTAHL